MAIASVTSFVMNIPRVIVFSSYDYGDVIFWRHIATVLFGEENSMITDFISIFCY